MVPNDINRLYLSQKSDTSLSNYHFWLPGGTGHGLECIKSKNNTTLKIQFFMINNFPFIQNHDFFTLKVHKMYKLVTVKQLSQLDWLAADYEVIKKLQSKYL